MGYGVERGADVISESFGEMSPAWRKEHDSAFEEAQVETKAHFHRCPKCTQWVCENCWNEQENLCVNCAPREAIEVAAARAQKRSADITAKTNMTSVFTGEIESKQTICPSCGKPAGTGKFCVNCGTSLKFVTCKKCGAKNLTGIKFCGNCGDSFKYSFLFISFGRNEFCLITFTTNSTIKSKLKPSFSAIINIIISKWLKCHIFFVKLNFYYSRPLIRI